MIIGSNPINISSASCIPKIAMLLRVKIVDQSWDIVKKFDFRCCPFFIMLGNSLTNHQHP